MDRESTAKPCSEKASDYLHVSMYPSLGTSVSLSSSSSASSSSWYSQRPRRSTVKVLAELWKRHSTSTSPSTTGASELKPTPHQQEEKLSDVQKKDSRITSQSIPLPSTPVSAHTFPGRGKREEISLIPAAVSSERRFSPTDHSSRSLSRSSQRLSSLEPIREDHQLMEEPSDSKESLSGRKGSATSSTSLPIMTRLMWRGSGEHGRFCSSRSRSWISKSQLSLGSSDGHNPNNSFDGQQCSAPDNHNEGPDVLEQLAMFVLSGEDDSPSTIQHEGPACTDSSIQSSGRSCINRQHAAVRRGDGEQGDPMESCNSSGQSELATFNTVTGVNSHSGTSHGNHRQLHRNNRPKMRLSDQSEDDVVL